MSDTLYTGVKSPALLDYLQKRRSCKIAHMGEPGPGAEEISLLLEAGARIPDHGKLFPWRFVVFTGEARKRFGDEVLRKAYLFENSEAMPAKLDLEAERLLRAPCVIAVISKPQPSEKVPVWEQQMSAGAAAYNICLAANALGYGTNWLTEWFSFNSVVNEALDVKNDDKIVGFIYIGTPTEATEERPRPGMKDIVTYWR